MGNKFKNFLKVLGLFSFVAACVFMFMCNTRSINRKRVFNTVNKNKDYILACVEEMYDILDKHHAESLTFRIEDDELYVKSYARGGEERIIDVENETIENMFSLIPRTSVVTIRRGSIEFLGWGGSIYYCGFCYVPGDNIKDASFYDVDGEWEPQGKGWVWEQSDGDNAFYYERICQYFYLFELVF